MKMGIGLIFALRGIGLAIRHERNMRIHLTAVFYVTVYAKIGQLEGWAWCAVLLCFGLVIGLELLNSALERLADEISENDRRKGIGTAKDMAAGGVLAGAAASVAAAAAVFLQPEVRERICTSPLSAWILLTLPIFAAFVVLPEIRDRKRQKDR